MEKNKSEILFIQMKILFYFFELTGVELFFHEISIYLGLTTFCAKA